MQEVENSLEFKFVDILKEIATRNSILRYEIKFESNSSPGVEGYASAITKVSIISKDDNQKQHFHLLIKSCDATEKICSILPIERMFKKEAYMYESVFPLFQGFEREHGLLQQQFAPKYHTRMKTTLYDSIIMDNLNKSGYSIHDKKSLLDDKHIKLVLKHYAHFHAISLAYRDQNPAKFIAIVEPLEDLFLELFKGGGFLDVFIKLMKNAGTSLNSMADIEVQKRYDKFVLEVESFLIGISSSIDNHSVIIHGDCWNNNMMFKYNNIDRTEPIDVRIFDYQNARLCNPMVDLANALYACSSVEVIDSMWEYVNLYYNELSNHIRALGSDPEKVYPQATMMQQWKQFACYGLFIRPSILNLLFSEEIEHKAVSEVLETSDISTIFDYQMTDINKYREICRHTIIHFVENDFI